jgi:hypothetical protein
MGNHLLSVPTSSSRACSTAMLSLIEERYITRCGECRFGEICAYKHGIDESKAPAWAMNEVGGEGELPKHEPSWTVFHLHC